MLDRAGLVHGQTAGRERYRIDEEQFARALAQLNAVCTAWAGRLQRIKRLAEARRPASSGRHDAPAGAMAASRQLDGRGRGRRCTTRG